MINIEHTDSGLGFSFHPFGKWHPFGHISDIVKDPVKFFKRNVKGAEHFFAHPPVWLQVIQPELSPAVQKFAANIVIPGKGAQLVDAARKVADAAAVGNLDAKTIMSQIPNVVSAMSGGGDTTNAIAKDLIDKNLSPQAAQFAAKNILGKSGPQLKALGQQLLIESASGHPDAQHLVGQLPAVIGAMAQGIGIHPPTAAPSGFGLAAEPTHSTAKRVMVGVGVAGLLLSVGLIFAQRSANPR